MAKDKERLMEGFCRGCGQMAMVRADYQSEADDEATRKCKCEESKTIRAEWEIVQKVEKVGSWESEDLGFKSLSMEVKDSLVEIGKLCLHDKITQGQIKVEDSVITITRKAASVGINRSMKVEIGEEAME